MSTENLLKEVNSYGNYGIIALVKGRNKARKKSIRLIENWLVTHSDLTGFKSIIIRIAFKVGDKIAIFKYTSSHIEDNRNNYISCFITCYLVYYLLYFLYLYIMKVNMNIMKI